MLHVYPLDAKTKEGNPFWSLPKRAPTPAIFSEKHDAHLLFVSSMACLRAKVFCIKIPSENPRTEEFRKQVGAVAIQFKVTEFVVDDNAAKEIQSSVDKTAAELKKKESEIKDDIAEEEIKQEDVS